MSMFREGPIRPPRPPMPRPEMDLRDGVAKRPSAGPRREPRQRPQARPQMPKQEAKSRLRDSRNVVPGGPGADTFLDDVMPFLQAPRDAALRGAEAVMPFLQAPRDAALRGAEAVMPFLQAPGRIVSGAVEGGIQAINPNFEMPDFFNAQKDFTRDIMMGGGQGKKAGPSGGLLNDAILRAILARMEGDYYVNAF